MKKIVLTGGGTAGHVNPNIALMPRLTELGYEIFYIGSYEGIEKQLIKETGVSYFSISTGKLRRYFDVKNFTDAFRVIHGVKQAYSVLKHIRPDVVFSKGGFVAVPVVVAAARLNIPVIIHEADATPGLANKISSKFAQKICVSFPETLESFPPQKAVYTGIPIRKELSESSRQRGESLCKFKESRPTLTIMGGSTGAVAINNAVRECVPELAADYNIIHLCGKGNLDESLNDIESYCQFEYVGKELPDVFAATDIIISRAGANAIFELLSLHIPNILIPLTVGSRGDQLINASSFEKSGYSYILRQEDLTKESLMAAISKIWETKDSYIESMKKSTVKDAVSSIINLIEEISS